MYNVECLREELNPAGARSTGSIAGWCGSDASLSLISESLASRGRNSFYGWLGGVYCWLEKSLMGRWEHHSKPRRVRSLRWARRAVAGDSHPRPDDTEAR